MFKLKNKNHSNIYLKNLNTSQSIIVSPPYKEIAKIPPNYQQYFKEQIKITQGKLNFLCQKTVLENYSRKGQTTELTKVQDNHSEWLICSNRKWGGKRYKCPFVIFLFSLCFKYVTAVMPPGKLCN